MDTLISQDIAKAIAKGDLDPITKVTFKKGKRDGAELVDIESFQLKNFKPERLKKKLDLSARTNLLTNYFCFASLEAKRKYRAPRASPKIENPENGILNTMSCAHLNSDGKMNSTSVVTKSVVYRAASDAVELPESQTCDEVDDSREDRRTQHNMLQHFIHKPCTASHKERTTDPSENKMRPESVNMIVRSSYFIHKATKEVNEVPANDIVAADADIVSDKYATRPASVDSERKLSKMRKNVVVRSAYFQGKNEKGKIQYDKNENQQFEEHIARHDNNLSCLDEIKSKSGERNDYRQESLVEKCENFAAGDGITTNIDNYANPRISSNNNYLEEARKRRKVASTDNPEAEDFRRIELLTGDDYTSKLGDTACEVKAQEEKFGCDISHIGRYSEIAEKSLENFVSVISSFKFTSNGSRASGLRAPLKDVKNTCSNRLSSNMDLSTFAYAPTKKASSTSRRV